MSDENPGKSDKSEAAPDLQKEVENLVEGAAGLFDSLKEIFLKSKEEVVRGAKLGKVRIDVFQLRKDREHFLQRLGEEVYELMQAGELEHADLDKPFRKLRALDEKIAEYEAEMAEMAEDVAKSAEAAGEEIDAIGRRAGVKAANDAEEAGSAGADEEDPSGDEDL